MHWTWTLPSVLQGACVSEINNVKFFKKKNKKRMELFGEVRWEVKDGALNVGIGQVRWKLTFFCFAFFLLKL